MEGRRVNHSAPKRNPLYVMFLCLVAAVFVLLIVVIVLGAKLGAAQKAAKGAETQIEELQEQVKKLEEEKKIIRQQIKGEKTVVRPILSTDEIIEARNVVREVYLDEKIEQYIADIVFATRYPEQYGLKDLKNYIEFGGSPRASINLALAARAYAFIKRRGYVIPEDVRAIAHDVLRHRIGLSYEAEANNISSEEIISQILNKVEVP